jgi:recombinational DNA repair protein (RecF pathway)
MPTTKFPRNKSNNHLEKRTFSEFGIILKVVPFGESDGIVTILTKHAGKFAVLAKGLKRSQKRFMGGLNPFDAGSFNVEERIGGKQLPVLLDITHRVFFSNLGHNLEAFAVASLGIEVVDSFSLDRDPEGGLFLVEILEMLKALDSFNEHNLGRAGIIALASKFVSRILTIAGFSDFETRSARSSELHDWLLGSKSLFPLPEEAELRALLSELVHSVELVTGKRLLVRPTLERIVGIV